MCVCVHDFRAEKRDGGVEGRIGNAEHRHKHMTAPVCEYARVRFVWQQGGGRRKAGWVGLGWAGSSILGFRQVVGEVL